VGAAVGLAAVATPLYEGPLVSLTGGVDLSFVLSGLVGGGVYAALTPARGAADPDALAAPGTPATTTTGAGAF
jgi:hypothetical protein